MSTDDQGQYEDYCEELEADTERHKELSWDLMTGGQQLWVGILEHLWKTHYTFVRDYLETKIPREWNDRVSEQYASDHEGPEYEPEDSES